MISAELGHPPSLKKLNDQHHERDDQENLDQVTGNAEPESQGQHHEQN